MTSASTEVRVWERLETLTRAGDQFGLEALLEELSPSEAARSLLRLKSDDQQQLLSILDPSDAAELIDDVPDSQAANMMERLPAMEAASILEKLYSDDQADLIGDLDEENADAILAEMSPEAAEDVRRLVEYDPLTAGGLMVTEMLVFGEALRVGDVLGRFASESVDVELYRQQHPYPRRPSIAAAFARLRP